MNVIIAIIQKIVIVYQIGTVAIFHLYSLNLKKKVLNWYPVVSLDLVKIGFLAMAELILGVSNLYYKLRNPIVCLSVRDSVASNSLSICA